MSAGGGTWGRRTCPPCAETTPGLGEQDTAAPRSRGSQPKGPTTLSYSSSVSLSPAVLLKLLVLEEEREMFDLPFSFSLMNGLGRRQNRAGGVTRKAALLGLRQRGQTLPSCRKNRPSRVFL